MNVDELFAKLEALLVLTKPYILRLWEKRLIFIGINLLGLTLVLFWLVVLYSPAYEAEVVIMPEYGGTTPGGSLTQITSLLGVAGGTGAPMEIYERLIKTPTILENVIYSQYYYDKLGDSVDLATLFNVLPNPKLRQRQQTRGMLLEAMDNLDQLISVSLDIQTKILTIKVIMPEGQMAADVANNIIASLNYYLNTRRQTKASNQLFYLEKRMSQVKDSLTIAEELLKEYRIKNRVITQSPELLLDQSRLIRNVDILQTVFIELTKQLELIRLDEIREAPVLNVREQAYDPIDKVNPKRRLKFTVGMFLSFIVSMLYCVFLPEIKATYNRTKEVFLRV
ncbi:MAG: hypothetical protein WCX28_05810 [Bacteriovoracaceae bacterium]